MDSDLDPKIVDLEMRVQRLETAVKHLEMYLNILDKITGSKASEILENLLQIGAELKKMESKATIYKPPKL